MDFINNSKLLCRHQGIFPVQIYQVASEAGAKLESPYQISWILTHWGQVTHICFSKLTIFGSDNGLLPGRRQAIIWTNAGILAIRTLGTNFGEILS